MEKHDGGSTAGFSTAGHKRVVESAQYQVSPVLPTLTILCHPDPRRIGDQAFLSELVRGREALVSREHPSFKAPGAFQGQALGDRYVSRAPLRLSLQPDGSLLVRRPASQMHVSVDGETMDDLLTMPPKQLRDGLVFELAGRIVLLFHRLARPPGSLPPQFGLVGDSAGIVEVRQTIERVAGLDVQVLLRGATGTGKELVARALHENSPRREQGFVGVNLGALTPSLATSELFGACKGAFTGADQDRGGYFMNADGGTLFLDEIGEASPEVQVMLLRALETHEIVPVGSQTPQPVNVRIISATDADLEDKIDSKDFRGPLFHRLMSYTIVLPSLTERRDDIGRLLLHFLSEERAELGYPPPPNPPDTPWLPAALVARLARYHWPGNVRQLRNVARQLVIDSHGQATLEMSHRLDALLPEPVSEAAPLTPSLDDDDTFPRLVESGAAQAPSSPASEEPGAPRKKWRKPREVSEEELLAALRRCHFEVKAAADDLGVSRTSIYALIKRSPKVRAAADVPPEEIHSAFDRHGDDISSMAFDLEISERALRQRLKDLGLR